MTVSEIVQFLAETLKNEIRTEGIDPQIVKYIDRVSSIGQYVKRARLDEWDADVQSITIDESTLFDRSNMKYFTLATELFNFGSYNLYCAFNASKTRKEFKKIKKSFLKYGVPVEYETDDTDLNEW